MDTSYNNNLGEDQIPEQTSGSGMDAVEFIQTNSLNEAKVFFEVVKKRLLSINKWYELAELPMSSFKLFDHSGRTVQRQAEEGDYIRIDIPGPGTKTGKGYDWVIIEALVSENILESEILSMRVRPAPHPLNPDQHIAHFLRETATSTFQVKRIDSLIYAEEHGRNEVPNTETPHTLDNLRNTLVGWGAKLGLSYPQWKSLLKGLLRMFPD